MDSSNIILGFAIWLACCLLLGYMGKERNSGQLKAFLVPFITGLVLWPAFWLLFVYWQVSASPFLLRESNIFLIPFVVSMVGGYLFVKLSPKIRQKVLTPDQELLYERAINFETKGNNERALELYKEAMRELQDDKAPLSPENQNKKKSMLESLKKKIEELEK